MNNIIKQTVQFLDTKLRESSYFKDHESEREYRFEHSIRVAHIGKLIAEQEGLNVENLVLGCLLHDIAYYLPFDDMGGWENHGRLSAIIARTYLTELGLEPMDIEEICYGIAIHVDDKSDFHGERTALAVSIGDADNIDRFDAYRIYEGLQYNKYSEKSLEEKCSFIKNYLIRLEELLNTPFATKTGKEMWIEKIEFQIEFYKKLYKQIENSTMLTDEITR